MTSPEEVARPAPNYRDGTWLRSIAFTDPTDTTDGAPVHVAHGPILLNGERPEVLHLHGPIHVHAEHADATVVGLVVHPDHITYRDPDDLGAYWTRADGAMFRVPERLFGLRILTPTPETFLWEPTGCLVNFRIGEGGVHEPVPDPDDPLLPQWMQVWFYAEKVTFE